jgi:hypothetical protein
MAKKELIWNIGSANAQEQPIAILRAVCLMGLALKAYSRSSTEPSSR